MVTHTSWPWMRFWTRPNFLTSAWSRNSGSWLRCVFVSYATYYISSRPCPTHCEPQPQHPVCLEKKSHWAEACKLKLAPFGFPPITGLGQQPKNWHPGWDVRLQTQVQPEGQEGLTEAAGQTRPARPGRSAAGRRRGGTAQLGQGHQGNTHTVHGWILFIHVTHVLTKHEQRRELWCVGRLWGIRSSSWPDQIRRRSCSTMTNTASLWWTKVSVVSCDTRFDHQFNVQVVLQKNKMPNWDFWILCFGKLNISFFLFLFIWLIKTKELVLIVNVNEVGPSLSRPSRCHIKEAETHFHEVTVCARPLSPHAAFSSCQLSKNCEILTCKYCSCQVVIMTGKPARVRHSSWF